MHPTYVSYIAGNTHWAGMVMGKDVLFIRTRYFDPGTNADTNYMFIMDMWKPPAPPNKEP